MAQLETSVMVVKLAENCLAHALIIAIVKFDNNQNYTSYRDGRKIRPVVQKLLAKKGMELSGCWRIPEQIKFFKFKKSYW